ncbi:hypothetical protein [Algoriphagus alkaliphilus]|uniref:hypothetical protein n=1 Tax=Algoriphagus alkaliphilus TaxID=279824 RepID=UPI000B8A2206|nr:hypothetical protein [Algoriphagus alkaliphilus]
MDIPDMVAYWFPGKVENTFSPGAIQLTDGTPIFTIGAKSSEPVVIKRIRTDCENIWAIDTAWKILAGLVG